VKERRLREELIVLFNYLMGGYRENTVTSFSEMHRKRIRGSRQQLQQSKFWLDIRGKKSK